MMPAWDGVKPGPLRSRRTSTAAKLTEPPLDRGLRDLLERVPVPWAFQVHARGGRERRVPDVGRARVRHVSAARFLASLP